MRRRIVTVELTATEARMLRYAAQRFVQCRPAGVRCEPREIVALDHAAHKLTAALAKPSVNAYPRLRGVLDGDDDPAPGAA